MVESRTGNHQGEEHKNFEIEYKKTKVDLKLINVLPQPRKTFEKIDELAQDIYEKGLLSPLLIIKFNEKKCHKYLETINSLWKTDVKINGLAKDKKEDYYILLAGERRLRAIKKIKEDHGSLGKVFPGNKIDIRLCENLSPLQALFRQASENIHVRPPANEEALFYASLLELIKEKHPDYSTFRFAKDVGKDPKTVKNAITFSILPEFVQKAVEEKQLKYGVACTIGRMQEENIDKETVESVTIRAMLGNWKIKKCKREVEGLIYEHKSNQSSFEIFSEEDRKRQEKESLKNLMAKEIKRGTWETNSYFKKIIFLAKEGKLNKAMSPFSEKEVLELYSELLNTEEEVLDHLKDLFDQKEKEKYKKTIEESKKLVKKLISSKKDKTLYQSEN